jgi:hypothetical protein
MHQNEKSYYLKENIAQKITGGVHGGNSSQHQQ